MKNLYCSLITFIVGFLAYGQGADLPYTTGFDLPQEIDGWQQYRTGFQSTSEWNTSAGYLSHDYNVGGNTNDTVIDWFVSPAFNLDAGGEIGFEIRSSGFSTPTPDNCEIWVGTDDSNPNNGGFVLLGNLSTLSSQNTWIDTSFWIDEIITSDSTFIAFKYKTIGAEWMTYNIDNIYLNDLVSIDELSSDQKRFSVYPNPTSNQSKILFVEQQDNFNVSILGLNGKILKSYNKNSGKEFDLNRIGISSGTYILKIEDDQHRISQQKLVITD